MVGVRISRILGSRAAVHLYLWLFFAAMMLLEPRDESVSLGHAVLSNLVFILTLVPPVYAHFFAFDKYFSRDRYRVYVPLTIAITLVFGSVNYLVIIKYHNSEISFLFSCFYLLLFMAITTALKTAKAWYDQRLLLREIQAQHLQTELELLKSQINPHFIFNTLNNLYGVIRKSDERAARGIATLSHLMRYMIHDSEVEQIALLKEIEQIERFIELQRLRFSKDDEITIDLHTRGDVSAVALPPMLLLPFVENAFKHGISLASPSYVIIDIHADKKRLRFSVRNSLHSRKESPREDTRGTGLRNARRRLELLYGDKHELSIESRGGEYSVTLVLELQGD